MRATLTVVNLTSLAKLRDEWIAAGLSTAPADRPEAEAGVREAYLAAGLEPPRAFAWLASPLAGYLGACLLSRDGLPGSLREHGTYGRWLGQAAEAGVGVLRQLGDPEAERYAGGRGGADLSAEARGAEADPRPAARPQDDPEPVWARVRSHLWGGIRGESWDRRIALARRAIRNRARDAADRRIADLLPLRLGADLRAWRNRVIERVDVRIGGPIRADLAARAAGGPVGDGERLLAGSLQHSLQGQHDAGWLSYYDYVAQVTRMREAGALAGLARVARAAGWWWPLPGLAVMTDRPESVRLDAEGRLHGENGPAIRYRDGYGVYALNGVRVSPRIAMHPGTITMDEVLGERNAAARRILADRFGRQRLAEGLGDRAGFFLDPRTEVVHTDEFGTLYRLAQSRGEPVMIVKVVNSTPEPDGSFKDYFLRVPPWMRTARGAVAWTFGMEGDAYNPGAQT